MIPAKMHVGPLGRAKFHINQYKTIFTNVTLGSLFLRIRNERSRVHSFPVIPGYKQSRERMAHGPFVLENKSYTKGTNSV